MCKVAYEYQEQSSNQSRHRVRFGLLVTRDAVMFFLVLQGTLALLGFITHWIDRAVNCPDETWDLPCNYTIVNGTKVGGTFITKLYPEDWANRNSISHLRLGNYQLS